MRSSIAGAVDALRRPEYTGENRCLPCTGVNAAIALVLAAIVTAFAPFEAARAAAVGVGVLLLAGVTIALRGYLVPGTPQLTKRYLPDRVLWYFDHHDQEPVDAGDVDPAAVLAAAGAVEECDERDDLCLTDSFRTAWRERMDAVDGDSASRSALAAMLDLPASNVDLEDHGDAFVARADASHFGGPPGERWHVGQWESAGAFIADVAGSAVLEARLPGWTDLDATSRGRVLNGLRVFLDRCPTCGGPVTFGDETVESCCRSIEVVAVTCDDCGSRLFEAEQPAAG